MEVSASSWGSSQEAKLQHSMFNYTWRRVSLGPASFFRMPALSLTVGSSPGDSTSEVNQSLSPAEQLLGAHLSISTLGWQLKMTL